MTILINDPVVLLEDATGDIDRASGSRFASGLQAVLQGVRARLALFRGEWFLDLDLGVPWLARDGVPASAAIFGQKFNELRARNAIDAAIRATPGGREVTTVLLAFNAATRALIVTWQASMSWSTRASATRN